MSKKYARPQTTGTSALEHRNSTPRNCNSERTANLHCTFDAARRRVAMCGFVGTGIVIALLLLTVALLSEVTK